MPMPTKPQRIASLELFPSWLSDCRTAPSKVLPNATKYCRGWLKAFKAKALSLGHFRYTAAVLKFCHCIGAFRIRLGFGGQVKGDESNVRNPHRISRSTIAAALHSNPKPLTLQDTKTLAA